MNLLNAQAAKERADKAIEAGIALFIDKTVAPQITLMSDNGQYKVPIDLSDFFLEERPREDSPSRTDLLIKELKRYHYAVSVINNGKGILVDWTRPSGQ